MKTLTIILAIFLISLNLYSQSNIFKLGFTGCYPSNYDYPHNQYHPWSNYTDLNMNYWNGWWVGDNLTNDPQVQLPWAIENLNSNNINGYLMPDTVRMSGDGKVVFHYAASNAPKFFYNSHYCGSDYQDNTEFGSGQYVRYFHVGSSCNEQSLTT